MSQSLKQKAISGIVWSGVQRFSTIAISFLSNLILARLLFPADFGTIGMLMVFIAIAGTLVDGGLASALIQKKEPTDKDYSTVFFFNLFISFFFYALLFLTAPAISSFYRMPQLCTLLRVMSIQVLFSALSIVQNNQLQKQLTFNRLATIDVLSTASGVFIAIILAYHGFGVWSLVIKTLLTSFIKTILYWIWSTWKPLLIFSLTSLKELFAFGALLLLSNMIETIVSQLVSLIIGRSYSAKDLGYYSQAVNLQQIPETTIPFVINQVFFPVFASIQDDVVKATTVLQTSLKALTFLNFPLMITLIIVAKPLIILLFTEKWLDSVPYFQLLCIGGMVYSINSSNVTLLMAFGQGMHILYMSLIKRGITFLSIIIGMNFGIYGIICGTIVSIYIWVPINIYFTAKLTKYGILKQIGDIGFCFILSLLVGAFVLYLFSFINIDNCYVLIAAQTFCYSSLYIIFAYLFKTHGFLIYSELIRSYYKHGFTFREQY